MTTRPYSDCLAQALALCGVPDANTVEVARVKTFINRRARQAYAESDLWPRWLVTGEERIVSEDGLLPYSQDGLQDIGTILRIHESQPFVDDPAGEYTDWSANNDGVQITGYVPSESESIVVSGSLVPDATGLYVPLAEYSIGGKPTYFLNGDPTGLTASGDILYWDLAGAPNWLLSFYQDENTFGTWTSLSDTDDPTTAVGWMDGTGTGEPFFEFPYSAFVTYKAAFSATYGTSDGETTDVPEEWFEWMATGAAASFLFSDKETESALLLESQAREDLDAQLAKVSRQNGNKVQTRVLTHGNMQAR